MHLENAWGSGRAGAVGRAEMGAEDRSGTLVMSMWPAHVLRCLCIGAGGRRRMRPEEGGWKAAGPGWWQEYQPEGYCSDSGDRDRGKPGRSAGRWGSSRGGRGCGLDATVSGRLGGQNSQGAVTAC